MASEFTRHDEEMVQQMSCISIRLHHRGFRESCRMILEARNLVLDILDQELLSFKQQREP